MMKKKLSIITLLSTFSLCFCQVGINSSNPETTFDIRGKNHLGIVDSKDGLLVPRVSDLSVNGSINGQLVYLISDNAEFAKGFYYWNSTKWTGLGGEPKSEIWMNDYVNNIMKLKNLSDGNTNRPQGTEIVVKDTGTVGIGTGQPDPSSLLDIRSSNKGVLVPRVSLNSVTDQVTVLSPAIGLLVYNTGNGNVKYKGFVHWNGSEWRAFGTGTAANPAISSLNCSNALAFPIVFTAGVPYSGTLTVPYSVGNGGSYQAGIPYTQNGLTFTLNPGTLNIGNGTIVYSISGTPNFSSPNTISVPLSFLNFNCNAIIGNNSSALATGEIKSVRITVPVNKFITKAGSRKVMNGKLVNNSTTTNRSVAFELASSLDQSKFIFIKGLRMDFMQSSGAVTSVSPKFFNTTTQPISYNVSSLSTYNQYIEGVETVIATQNYSYNIDGNDDFVCVANSSAEYVNAMVTFDDGEWYNCTWHATNDGTNYNFYMTAQRLN